MRIESRHNSGTKQAFIPVSVALSAVLWRQRQTADAPLLCHSQQVPAGHEQIRQTANYKQPVGILIQTPIAHFRVAEDSLDHEERVFNFRPHLRLGSIPGFVLVAQRAASAALLIGEIRGQGRVFAQHLTLAGVGRVAPHPGFFAVQQVRQCLAVMHIRRRRNHRMDQFGPTVDTDMRLHAKVPQIAFPGLVHFGVPRLVLVLGRAFHINMLHDLQGIIHQTYLE